MGENGFLQDFCENIKQFYLLSHSNNSYLHVLCKFRIPSFLRPEAEKPDLNYMRIYATLVDERDLHTRLLQLPYSVVFISTRILDAFRDAFKHSVSAGLRKPVKHTLIICTAKAR